MHSTSIQSAPTGRTAPAAPPPHQVAVEVVDTRAAVIDAIAAKRVVKFDATKIVPDAPFDRPLRWWEQHHADATVHRHAVTTGYAATVERFLGPLAPDATIDLRELPRHDGRLSLARVDGTLREMIAKMEPYAGFQPDRSYSTIKVTCAEQRESYRRLDAYGVTNAKAFEVDWALPSPFEGWKRAYNFLWFGLTPGAMHYDQFDNMLIQLSGRKQVLIYDPELCDAVDGQSFITRFPMGCPHAPEVLSNHKLLRHLPYYKLELEPGTGVVLPARAYHAPLALTHDAISLNSFLLPYLSREPKHFEGRLVHTLAVQAVMGMAALAHRAFGVKLMRVGPYDFY